MLEVEELKKLELVEDTYSGDINEVVVARKPANMRRIKRLLSKAVDLQNFRLGDFKVTKVD
ncbi:hypothetical protein L6251_01630 [Candidatus Parcubacteria bacterium]|nr:hypothetical protein [Patescibacteria group bacterium]MBU4476878.1 hypothetical protein [Patescibacteria group bacterium]MCG2699101.1 hypothetical protein [Candidatus Parcubacteria bacterium]